MPTLPNWSAIEEDVRIGLVLAADACRYMVGMGARGDRAAGAILGIAEVPAEHLDDCIEDPGFLRSVAVSDTAFSLVARRCFDLVTILQPIEEIAVEDERAEGADWLSFFLSFMPRRAMGGLDYTGVFHHPDAPLVILRDMAEARLALAEYVQNLVRLGQSSIGFTPRQIAFLGDVDLRTVRNAMGPKGDKPIRSNARPKPSGVRSDLVFGDPLDAIEWLAGRRGFHAGRLTPGWVDRHLAGVTSLQAAAALPGLVAWLNRTTTEELAANLGWPVGRARDWTRGRGLDAAQASDIGAAAGLDGGAYRDLMQRLTCRGRAPPSR